MPDFNSKSPITYFSCDLTVPQLYQFNLGDVSVYTSRAIGKETINEDALAMISVDENSMVLVIADGLGGLPAGEGASRMVINELVKTIGQSVKEGTHLRGAILDGIEKANDKIMELQNGSATTVVIAEISKSEIRAYHAGDSMLMMIGNGGKLKYTAIPHSPTGYALESGLIDEKEAMQHEERHIVSNVIGSPDMRLEIGPRITMAPRDTLILASDGLSDNLFDGEIIEASRKGPLINNMNNLVAESRKMMVGPVKDRLSHPDDLSIIMFRMKN